MTPSPSFVDRIRPLIAHRPRGEQLFLAALLENGAAERYREWAGKAADPDFAEGLRECAEREDTVAGNVRKHFGTELRQPADLSELIAAVQKEVVVLFGGLSMEEQFDVQAKAERGGQQLWVELAAAESDSSLKEVFEECAKLEAASAEFLEKHGAA
jgi:rubrerythrin